MEEMPGVEILEQNIQMPKGWANLRLPSKMNKDDMGSRSSAMPEANTFNVIVYHFSATTAISSNHPFGTKRTNIFQSIKEAMFIIALTIEVSHL